MDLQGRLDFAMFSEDDRHLLAELRPHVANVIDDILGDFYDHVLKNPTLKAMFEVVPSFWTAWRPG